MKMSQLMKSFTKKADKILAAEKKKIERNNTKQIALSELFNQREANIHKQHDELVDEFKSDTDKLTKEHNIATREAEEAQTFINNVKAMFKK